MKHFLGVLKPKADVRDYTIAAGASEYPESYLCENLPPVKNQRNVSSCVAHATAIILETLNHTETNQFVQLSTNFIYGMQGIAFGRMDSGMYLREACKIVQKYGDPTYNTIKGNTEQPKCTEKLKEQLTDAVYQEASIYKIKSYARCKTPNQLKHALMTYGPVLGSIKWYQKYTLKNKILFFDKNTDYDRHAIVVCGWNAEGWICQNSWGRTWNGDGRFIYPYDAQFAELWSFVDATNDDVSIPKNNQWPRIIYKILNMIINWIRQLVQ